MDLICQETEEIMKEMSKTELYTYLKQSSERPLDNKLTHMENCLVFSIYCKETAELYVRLHGWYSMTPTLHKILAHGPTIIKYATLPIGQLSEEAAEARNKHFRQYTTDFARKFSRTSCNMDVLNRLLLSSDPFLSCSRPRCRKQRRPFTQEALDFFLSEDHDHPDNREETTTEDESDSSCNEFD